MDYVIDCEKVSKSYGNISALRDVTLKLEKGSFLAIFGPNGAGKTTLLKILSHLIKPTSGTVKSMEYCFMMRRGRYGKILELSPTIPFFITTSRLMKILSFMENV